MGRRLVSTKHRSARPSGAVEPSRDGTGTASVPTRAQSLVPPGAWRDMGLSLVLALGLAAACHALVAEARFIPSPSMVPTLAIGDRLVIEKVSYRVGPPKRGDIVVFQPPVAVEALGYMDTSVPWIKRVIGLPGESVSVTGGHVLINGQPIADPYPSEAPNYEMAARIVPQGQLFVLGDNRNHSIDSHIWGTVGIERVIGRACFRFWPPARFGELLPQHEPKVALGL